MSRVAVLHRTLGRVHPSSQPGRFQFTVSQRLGLTLIEVTSRGHSSEDPRYHFAGKGATDRIFDQLVASPTTPKSSCVQALKEHGVHLYGRADLFDMLPPLDLSAAPMVGQALRRIPAGATQAAGVGRYVPNAQTLPSGSRAANSRDP